LEEITNNPENQFRRSGKSEAFTISEGFLLLLFSLFHVWFKKFRASTE